MDIMNLTYTDSNGDEHNAHEYLMRDGNLGVPGGAYGSDTRSCAPIALLLYAVLLHANGSDCHTVECLDGCMSQVVNSGDEVAWTILDNQSAFEWENLTLEFDGEPCSAADFFDDETIEYARELYMHAYDGEVANF